MPTVEFSYDEFIELFDPDRTPALPAGHPFLNIQSTPYWTSSTGYWISSGFKFFSATCMSVIDGSPVYQVDQNERLSVWAVKTLY